MRKSLIAHVIACTLLLLPFVASAASPSLENPLRFDTISGFIAGLLQAIVYISLPLISLAIVYSGFMFVKARGNASELETARKNFVYVVIGAILILGAWALAELVGGTINQLRSGL